MISTKHHRLKTKLQFILQHINKDETAGRKKTKFRLVPAIAPSST